MDIKPQTRSTKGVKINQEYFSGAQASLFIGDTWVDDIIAIDYSLQHTRAPIYGYGSQHFDFVPKGNILVTGSFKINFREPNYLWLILERFKRMRISNEKRTATEGYRKEADLKFATNAETYEKDVRRRYEHFFNSGKPGYARASLIEQAREFNGIPEDTTVENYNHPVFDVVIGYGKELKEDSIGETISSVHVMGKSKLINADGRPIAEQYNFIARRVF